MGIKRVGFLSLFSMLVLKILIRFMLVLVIAISLGKVFLFAGTWTQSTATDWGNGTATNVDTTTYSGSVALTTPAQVIQSGQSTWQSGSYDAYYVDLIASPGAIKLNPQGYGWSYGYGFGEKYLYFRNPFTAGSVYDMGQSYYVSMIYMQPWTGGGLAGTNLYGSNDGVTWDPYYCVLNGSRYTYYPAKYYRYWKSDFTCNSGGLNAFTNYTGATYTSPVMDCKYSPSSWGTFNTDTSMQAGTSVTFLTRTSSDSATWSSWANIGTAGENGGIIHSPTDRYIQWQVSIVTDGQFTPTLCNSATVYFTQNGSYKSQYYQAPPNWGGWTIFVASDTQPAGTSITYNAVTATSTYNLSTNAPFAITNGGNINSAVGPYIQIIPNFSRAAAGIPKISSFTVTWNCVYPQLTWVGTDNLTSSAIMQSTLPTGSTVCYYIAYKDSAGVAPKSGYPKLHVLKGGTDITGSPWSMDYQGGSYISGALFTSSHTITVSGNDYSYYFECYDVFDTSGTSPTGTGPVMAGQTVLSWVGSSGYVTDGVDPDYAPGGSMYSFKIMYADSGASAPKVGYPKLRIYLSGVEISGSPFLMDYVSGNYGTGAIYKYDTQLAVGVGYSYSFEALNAFNMPASSITVNGPIVNTAPKLAWTGESDYTSGGVVPSVGAPGTDNFCFRVSYSDADNDEPKSGYPRVRISKNGVEISSSPFAMTRETDAPATGSKYSLSKKFSDVGNDYTYYFETYDIWNSSACTNTCSFTVGIPPDITVYPVSKNGYAISGLVHLSWADDSGEGSTYRLYFGTSTTAMALVYEGTATGHDIRNLDSGKTYYWQIECVNRYGLSSKTAVQSFMTVDTPTNTYNYPNPFHAGRENTNIVFNASGSGSAEFYVFSEFGKKLYHTTISAIPGTNSFAYDGRDDSGNVLFNGSYPFIVSVDGKRLKNSILVVK